MIKCLFCLATALSTALGALAIGPLALPSTASRASASGLPAAGSPLRGPLGTVSFGRAAFGSGPRLDLGPTASPEPAVAATDRPVIAKVTPQDGARGVSRSIRIRITFSEPVDGMIWMTDLSQGTCVASRASVNPRTMTVTIAPRSRLAANHTYRLVVMRATSLESGGELAEPLTIVFHTGSH